MVNSENEHGLHYTGVMKARTTLVG